MIVRYHNIERMVIWEMEKVLYGNESNNCAAFCKYHNCCMTVKQLRTKECLKKQCRHLQKYDHPYWRQREILKNNKKEKKNMIFIKIN